MSRNGTNDLSNWISLTVCCLEQFYLQFFLFKLINYEICHIKTKILRITKYIRWQIVDCSAASVVVQCVFKIVEDQTHFLKKKYLYINATHTWNHLFSLIRLYHSLKSSSHVFVYAMPNGNEWCSFIKWKPKTDSIWFKACDINIFILCVVGLVFGCASVYSLCTAQA